MPDILEEQNLLAEKLLPKKKNAKRGKIVVIIASALFLFFATGGALAYAGKNYQERVLPGVMLGSAPMGGMTKNEVKEFIAGMYNKLGNGGVAIKVNTARDGVKNIRVFPLSKNKDQPSLVALNIEAEADRLVRLGKTGNIFRDGLAVARGRLDGRRVSLASVYVNEEEVIKEIKKQVGAYQSEAVNAGLKIHSISPLSFAITTSSPGIVYDYSNLAERVVDSWSNLESGEVVINSRTESPLITEDDVRPLIVKLSNIFASGGLTLAYDDADTKRKHQWTITARNIGDWLAPVRENGVVVLGLDKKALDDYLEQKVLPTVAVPPANARFVLNEEKTKTVEFTPSHAGVDVDKEKLALFLNDILNERLVSGSSATTTVAIPIAMVEARIKTGDANDLGISEVLGVGYSNFSGSPKNRILNIKNAVKNKLHGILIAPDQEFSLVNTLKPFTTEAGYLPELVIIGNRIKPEIAGGLCQIGTTMFRTVMNSALPVTARTNHGLVISYYNDPRNGNPGTDATIYEPWPDFKFKNDTGRHLLITTDMNTANGELYFTLWGTSDGRKGSYTAPKVSAWIPAGPAQTIETATLPPGKKECQTIHNGAVASFTYTREFANGEKKDEVFKSVYRAVPAICFVGKSEPASCDPATDPNGCVAPNATVPTAITPNGETPITETAPAPETASQPLVVE